MRKKSIFVFCFMLFLLFLGTNTIHAQMRTFEVDGINYRVIQEPDGTMTTGTISVCQIEYGEYEGDIVIPNAVKETGDQYADKYKVVSIDNSAFAQTKNLKSVKLPPSIESIGDSTFFLSSVVRVDMPIGNLKVIGESVFEQSKLDSIDIPSTVKVIGKNAFSNCVELKSVILHEGLTSIGNGAFHTCINLETLHLPNTLKAIGNEAFYFCIRLAIVDVGNGLKSIGSKAFFSCHRLRSFEFPDGIREIGSWAFQSAGIVEIAIPPSIKVIKEGCFSESMLRRVTLSHNLASIEDYAFAHCNLDTLIVTSSTSVSRWAFMTRLEAKEWIPRQIQRNKNGTRDSSSAVSFNIPEGKEYDRVVSKLEKTIDEKNKITVDYSAGEVGIGADVSIIKIKDLFYRLISYPIKGEEYGIVVVTNGSYFREWSQTGPYFIEFRQQDASGHVKIPEVIEIVGGPYPEKYIVAGIERSAFENHNKVTSIDIPASVGTFGIGRRAFKGTGITEIKIPDFMEVIPSGLLIETKIKKIFIPQWIKIIGADAFSGCTGLTSIVIPSNVTRVGSGAFSQCTGLTSVTIAKGVTSIGSRTFARCNNIKHINLPVSVTTIGDYAFEKCITLTSIIIPSRITTLSDGTFKNCTGLTFVAIPNGVTALGEDLFYGCSSLKSVTIPETVTTIGNSAFKNCNALTSITIPNGVTTIGKGAFSGCVGLDSLIIGKGLTKIGYNAFEKDTIRFLSYNCQINVLKTLKCKEKLQTVVIGSSVTAIVDEAFYGCGALTSIAIPNSITSIGNSAFENCSTLTSIVIPNSITSIGNRAFKNCSALNSISIPNRVSIIGNSAFENCSTLTSIVIPPSVVAIGNSAFINCKSITSVTLSEGLKEIGQWAFYGCKIESLMIPCGVEKIGSRTFTCKGLKDVVICGNPCEWIVDGAHKYIFGGTPQLKIHLNDAKFADCAALKEYKDKVECP